MAGQEDSAREAGPEGRRLPAAHRIEPFDSSDRELARQVVGMWTRGGALTEAQAAGRLAEVAFVAVEERRGVVAVATVRLTDGGHLRMPLWSYRTFVDPAHRESDIAFLLLHRTRAMLRSRWEAGDARAAGMVMEVQNEMLRRARNEAVWRTTGFTFVGEDEIGAHHRVLYFPGARAPLPELTGSPR
jgi:hypothetical protein